MPVKIAATFIIPTFNAGHFLPTCLKSIYEQNVSKNEYEVLVLDGGSTDETHTILNTFKKKLPLKVIHNHSVDAESGKRIGISQARGRYIILLDADNQIIGKSWLKQGITILDKHPELWGVESPWLVNPKDTLLNQYFALIKVTDTVARVFSPTSSQMVKKDFGPYTVITIHDPKATPIIGANGFFYRKSLVEKEITKTKKFEEVNYVAELISKGHQNYAQLNGMGIYHYYCDSIMGYIQKRKKIAGKFLHRKAIKQTTWLDKVGPLKFAFAVLYNYSVIGPGIEAMYQYIKTKNTAWFYHPLISWITVSSYTYFFIRAKLGNKA
jgi:glycosyltransferase involved in cell wall biosynthesis